MDMSLKVMRKKYTNILNAHAVSDATGSVAGC